jgi:hypothetical protein
MLQSLKCEVSDKTSCKCDCDEARANAPNDESRHACNASESCKENRAQVGTSVFGEYMVVRSIDPNRTDTSAERNANVPGYVESFRWAD